MTSTDPNGSHILRSSGSRPGAVASWNSMAPEAPGQRRVRLAILDDHEVLLDSLSSWINVNAYDFDLVLTAHTWLQLVHSDNFPTDLVFLDFQLKEPVSIEARVRTCRAAGAKVVVLSSLDTRESRERALDAGASAFLSKALPMREVMDAARQVMGVARDSAPQRDWRPLPVGASNQSRPKLSAGEAEAFRLYVSGFSTRRTCGASARSTRRRIARRRRRPS